MSLFGKIKSAVTSDLGTFLTQGTQGLDRKRNIAEALKERQRLEGVRGQLLQDYEAAMTPQYPQATSFDSSLEGSPDQLPEVPQQEDQTQQLRRAFMRAQLQGLPLGGADKTLDSMAPDFDVINGGDGSYGIVNKGTGSVQAGQLPNQYQDLVEELKRMQIEAAKALAYQRQQSGVLSAAKAKTGGFAPRQPRAGPKTLPPLPGGKTPVIVSQ